MAFEAYSVAVKLSLINNVSAGLLLISKSLQSANMDAKLLQSSLGAIGKRMAIGGVMFAGGLAIASLFKAPIEEAEKYQNALTRFKQMNLGDAVNKDADSMARHANAFGTSATEMMNTLRDLHAAFGSYNEAKQFAPKVAALNAANKSIYGDGHGVDEGETKALAKVIEMRGGTVNPAAFNRELDLMQRMKNATGGVLDAKMLRAYMSTAGVAGRSLSDKGLENMSGLIVEMGGQRAGTATMSMYQNLIGGRTTKKAMGELASLGLGTLSEAKSGHVGGAQKTTQTLTNIKGADELKADPVGWIKDVLLPQFKAKGITDQSTILKTINDIMTNRTGSSMASITATQLSVIMKDAANARNAHGVDATIKDAKGTLSGQMADLSAKWSGVMLELGVTVLPMAISAVRHLIPVLQSLSTFIQNNQTAVKLFAGALLGLSAFLMGGGLINMIIAAGRGFGLLYTVLGRGPGILSALARYGSTLGKAFFALRTGIVALATSPFVAGLAQAVFGPFILLGKVAATAGRALLPVMGSIITFSARMLGSGILLLLKGMYLGVDLVAQGLLFAGRAMLMNPIGLTLTAIGVAAYLVYRNWDTILPKLNATWTSAKNGLIAFGAWLGDFFGNMRDSLKALFLPVWTAIKPVVPLLAGVAGAAYLIWKDWGTILPKLKTIWSAITDGILNMWNHIKSFFGLGGDVTKDTGKPKQTFIPKSAAGTIQVHSTINMDGKKVAEGVSTHQGRWANSPYSGSGHDGNLAMPLPGAR